ncbi:MAG: helix-turn-helix domain-containing protein [Oscillochloris sp.]|nr:helix-turn-helix domain-containing protein [Oscillochloris sp.]
MTHERKSQGSTRQRILDLLRRNGEMTALDLSAALDIGAVGVRQHLATLERDQLVRSTGLRRSIGRPAHLYTLTEEAAERRFPKHYEHLALDVLDAVMDEFGADAVNRIFTRRREAIAGVIAPLMAGKSLDARIAELTRVLSEQGYMCELEQLEDGSFLLTEYNCPFDCVARRHQQLCDQEIRLYAQLLDTPVFRDTETIASGGHCCCYRIPAESVEIAVQ